MCTKQKQVIGLIGPIGSGKSTVARRLAGHEGTIISADTISRDSTAPGTPIAAKLSAAFPACTDRAALAARVFTEPTVRRTLQALVYPELRRRLRRAIHTAPDGIVVVEAANLYELLPNDIDHWVNVVADEHAACTRARSCHAWDEQTIRNCYRYQLSMPGPAHYRSIKNNGSFDDLHSQVEMLKRELAR